MLVAQTFAKALSSKTWHCAQEAWRSCLRTLSFLAWTNATLNLATWRGLLEVQERVNLMIPSFFVRWSANWGGGLLHLQHTATSGCFRRSLKTHCGWGHLPLAASV